MIMAIKFNGGKYYERNKKKHEANVQTKWLTIRASLPASFNGIYRTMQNDVVREWRVKMFFSFILFWSVAGRANVWQLFLETYWKYYKMPENIYTRLCVCHLISQNHICDIIFFSASRMSESECNNKIKMNIAELILFFLKFANGFLYI